jgi:hypothetical protein
MNKRNRVFRLMAVFAALAMVVSACTDDDSATTEAPATTQAPATTDASGTTEAPGTTDATATTEAPPTVSSVFTTALVADLTTDNFWAYLDPESSVHNGYVLGQSQPALYTISVPDFLHIPVLAAGAAPDLVQEGENWTATIPLPRA